MTASKASKNAGLHLVADMDVFSQFVHDKQSLPYSIELLTKRSGCELAFTMFNDYNSARGISCSVSKRVRPFTSKVRTIHRVHFYVCGSLVEGVHKIVSGKRKTVIIIVSH